MLPRSSQPLDEGLCLRALEVKKPSTKHFTALKVSHLFRNHHLSSHASFIQYIFTLTFQPLLGEQLRDGSSVSWSAKSSLPDFIAGEAQGGDKVGKYHSQKRSISSEKCYGSSQPDSQFRATPFRISEVVVLNRKMARSNYHALERESKKTKGRCIR